MAVAIIVLTILSLFVVGISVYVFQPAVFDLSFNTSFWAESNNVDTDLRIAKDTLYDATIAIPVIGIAGIALWAYLSVNRRDDL